MDRPQFRQSLETQELVKVLSAKDHADIFTYEELSKAAGVDVQVNRGPLDSARRIVQREASLVFEAVPKIGVKRASDIEIVDGRARDVSRIRNIARRGIKALGCVRNFMSLPKDKQQQHNLTMSGLGLLHHVTTVSAQNKIAAKVETMSKQLPVAETLAALTNQK